MHREAFAAGYSAAMHSIRDLTSRLAPGAASAGPHLRRAKGRSARTTTRSGATAATRLRAGASGGVTRRRRTAAGLPQRFSTGAAPFGRAARRQQDLAPPQRRILSRDTQTFGGATRVFARRALGLCWSGEKPRSGRRAGAKRPGTSNHCYAARSPTRGASGGLSFAALRRNASRSFLS